MTDLELIAIFAGSWILAAAVWMLLDWAARPKHSRFHAKADRVQRGPLEYRHFRKVRRAEENEEIRLRLTERTGKPTLATRSKRRDKVLARHDRPKPEVAVGNSVKVPVTVGASKTDEQFWIDLRDSSFDDANAARLEAGTPPLRYNPITDEDEEMIRTEADTAVWPGAPVDPYSGQELARTGEAAPSSTNTSGTSGTSGTDEIADAGATGSTTGEARDGDAAGETDEIADTDHEAEDHNGEQVTERVVRDLKSLPEAG